MMNRLTREQLSAIPLFKGLKEDALDFLMEKLLLRFFRNGSVIAEDNEPADSMFIIIAGNVEIEKNGEFLAQRVIGEVIGEQALIESTVRNAEMVACGSVELLELDRETYDALIEMDSQFSRNVSKTVSEKLRQKTHEFPDIKGLLEKIHTLEKQIAN